MQWMLLPLRRYARFNGRARPKEYWMFVLFMLLCLIALSIVETALGLAPARRWAQAGRYWASAGYESQGGPLIKLFLLGVFIPWIAVAVRRLHDSDRSGWWLLASLIPIIGQALVFIFLIMGGTRGPNRFGQDPVEVGEGGQTRL